MNNINNESDSHLTEQEQIVYEIFKKKQEIIAIEVKEIRAEEKKQLKQYPYQIKKLDSRLVEKMSRIRKTK